VEARLSGPEIPVLRDLTARIKAIMQEDENARTIRTDWGDPVLVQVVAMAKAQAQSIGVTRPEIARALAMNFSGSRVGTYRHDDDLLPIILFGMLMKNEIVLLNQINLELANGKQPCRAIVDAAVSRVRPVSMAAFTAVLGMVLLLWDAFFSPMAVTIMGGLTFATVLTLVVVPVLYATVFRVHKVETL
jgi:multidrug efflux pump subunit AcrB